MEKMWFYVIEGSDRQGPVPESELRALAESSRVKGTDLVWTDGQPDWRPLSTVAEFGDHPDAHVAAPAAAPVSYAAGTHQVPPGLAGWMTFVGVMNIIAGVITCLNGLVSIVTIIGPFIILPFGVLLILSGTALTGGKDALLRVSHLDENMEVFLIKMKRYMVIMGSFYIVSIVLTILSIILLLVMILGMGMSLTEMVPTGGPGM